MSHQFPAPPLIYVGEHQPQETQINLIQETAQGIEQTNIIDLQRLDTALANAGPATWVRVAGLKNVDVINDLCSHYQIHPLVIEDILHTQQMPKVDIFNDYLYVVVRVPKKRSNKKKEATSFNQVSFIIMKNRLFTFQEENDDSFLTIQKYLMNYLSKTRKLTVDYIFYLLFDAILDYYVNLTDHQSEIIEDFETKLIKNPENLSLVEFYKLKRNVMDLRKTLQPMRDVVSVLSRQGSEHLIETTHIYFNNLYDHCLRILEQLDTYRDLLTSMLEIYRSSVNNKLNESMRILTLIATIFIPITFFASLFSMNFKYQPPLEWRYGFHAVIGLVVVTVIGMLIYFRKKKWI